MKNKKYLLYGLGLTNQSIKKFFNNNNIKYAEYVDGIGSYDLKEIDIVIKSPGIRNDTNLLKEARDLKIPIYSDLELFSLFYPKAKIIIITGTNGKTSTSRMLSVVLSKKFKCYLGGNIGLPLFSMTSKKNFKDEIVIVEASSFMLENCYSVKPFIYVITNISKHHLDHHKNIESYIHCKTKLINNMSDNDLVIIHKKDYNLIEKKNLDLILLDESGTTKNIKIQNNKLYYDEVCLFGYNNNIITPKHQLMNMAIVSEIALKLGLTIERIKKGLEDVTCEKYRLQIIYKDDNTIIINDAKSTNFDASMAALESITNKDFKVHWILGGHNEENYDLSIINSADKFYLYGENRTLLSKPLETSLKDYLQYETLEEVIKSIERTNDKKIILYSPAAQSYDQYNNFEERGEHFNFLINKYWHN